jgi:hypothetical protein
MKLTKTQKIRNYIEANPEATTSEIVKATKAEPSYIYVVRNKMKHAAIEKNINKHMDNINAMNEAKEEADTASLLAEFAKRFELDEADSVNHPLHYTVGGIETIDFIEAKQLGYHLGNVVKYVSRAKHKGNTLEDLNKAKWYLDRAIAKLNS